MAGIFGGCENCNCNQSNPGGGCGDCANCTYITQTPCSVLTNNQALSLLGTGLLKNTTITGVLTIATPGTDFSTPITVREKDGSPSITPTTIIEFDQDAGLVVTNPGTAIARVTSTGKGLVHTVPFLMAGGGSPVATGIQGFFGIDYNCEIIGVTVYCDATATLELDIEKTTFAGFPGSFASIVAAAPPSISAGVKSQDFTIAGWTTTVNAGDAFRVSVNANDNAQIITLLLKTRRT